MPWIEPTILFDLVSTVWIISIAIILFVRLPINGLKTRFKQDFIQQQKSINDVSLLGLWLRNILLIIIVTLSLGYFNLINWLTVALIYSLCIFANHLKSHRWDLILVRHIIQSKIIGLVDFLDQGISFEAVFNKIINSCHKSWQKINQIINNLVAQQGIVFFILLIATIAVTFIIRWEYPLAQLRFSHPDNYNTLLIARQLLAKNYPNINHLPVFPSLIAIISLLGSVEPMHAIRFLSPLIGIALVISIGFMFRAFACNAYSALVAMFTLGVYLFTVQTAHPYPLWLNSIIESLNSSLVRQWTGNELELGTIFLLLGLGYAFKSDRSVQKTLAFKINLLASILLVAICAPPLLIIFAVASIRLIGDNKVTLTAIILTWIMLALFAVFAQDRLLWLHSFLLTLPVALSLLAGILFIIVSNIVQIFSPQWGKIFCLGLLLALSINFFLPIAPTLTYLEYDMAARKTLEIKKYFPPQSWILVAPIEQLAEIYGEGWYQDLALFVEQYADQAGQPGFEFPDAEEELFIMVEKIPFVTFPNEPDVLPTSILSDRTYQHYR